MYFKIIVYIFFYFNLKSKICKLLILFYNLKKNEEKIFNIEFEFEDSSWKILHSRIEKYIRKTIEYFHFLNNFNEKNANLGVFLVKNEKIKEINNKYRQKDKVTDVISFPYLDCKDGEFLDGNVFENLYLGDVFCAIDFIKEDCGRNNTNFDENLMRIVIHGILHLIGFDHIKDEDYAIMNKKEDEIFVFLSNLG